MGSTARKHTRGVVCWAHAGVRSARACWHCSTHVAMKLAIRACACPLLNLQHPLLAPSARATCRRCARPLASAHDRADPHAPEAAGVRAGVGGREQGVTSRRRRSTLAKPNVPS
jgi:hypothetical protein